MCVDRNDLIAGEGMTDNKEYCMDVLNKCGSNISSSSSTRKSARVGALCGRTLNFSEIKGPRLEYIGLI